MNPNEKRLQLLTQKANIEREQETVDMIVNWGYLRESLFDRMEIYAQDRTHCFDVESRTDRNQIIEIIDNRVKKMCLDQGLELPDWAKE